MIPILFKKAHKGSGEELVQSIDDGYIGWRACGGFEFSLSSVFPKYFLFFFLFFFFLLLFRAALTAYVSSQARGRIRATAAGLHHSHSNSGSEPCLRPTPQLMTKPDP